MELQKRADAAERERRRSEERLARAQRVAEQVGRPPDEYADMLRQALLRGYGR